jgi:transposase
MANKKSYDPGFKREAVLLCEGGRTVGSVAGEFSISYQTVSGWLGRWRRMGEAAFPVKETVVIRPSKKTLSADELEIQRLRKEVEILRMEREILKKATAFFAKESK